MKNIFLTATVIFFTAGALYAGGAAAAPKAAQFKKYSMDHGYFSCLVPSSWTLEREKERDAAYGIFEIQLVAPGQGKAPTTVFVSYYSAHNDDFDGYADFIDRNSTNALGETRSDTENYEPVKKIKLGVRKGYELAREKTVFLHPESKSDENVLLKEKLYVLPARAGFYVLQFSAPADRFAENLPVFEKIAVSFKGRF